MPPPPEFARGYDGFQGTIGRTISRSRPWWRERPRAPQGSPNVVVVLLDDLGFADFAPYGSEIDTPTVTRLAENGVLFTNYHTTPLCSPSRAALLTGLNPHRAGFAFPANSDPGYPSYSFELPENAPTLAESLRDSGYATFAVGKWHLVGDRALNDAADRASWPVQRGFDRYFGSLEGFTSLHAPHRLTTDNSPYDVAEFPEGYFLTDDLTDRAIGLIRALRANDADKPFFLYFAHHAVHGPIQAKPADLQKYRGRYDSGWDDIRSERFRRQIAAGLFPPGTPLPRSNSEPGKDVPAWESLTGEQRERFARYMEVYAASVDNVDANLARLVQVLEQYGELDNTIIVVTSDNGATAEGGAEGTRSYFSQFAHVHGLPADWDRDVDRDLDLHGGPRTTVHYPRGWGPGVQYPVPAVQVRHLRRRDPRAADHPLAGRAAPHFRIHRSRLRIGDRIGSGAVDDGIRHQFVYVTDLAQTGLDLAGIPRSAHRNNLPAADIDGVSAVDIVRDPDVPVRHLEQYTETLGNRGYFSGGWKVVTNHRPGTAIADAEWELYDLTKDPTETVNLAQTYPDKLGELAAAWEQAAWHNTVFPIDDLGPASAFAPALRRTVRPPGHPVPRNYHPGALSVGPADRPPGFTITVDVADGDEGVLLAHGDQGGGYLAAVLPDDTGSPAVHVVVNSYDAVVRSRPLPVGPGRRQQITVQVTAETGFRWNITVSAGGGAARLTGVPQLLGMAPFTGISVGADRGGPVDWDLYRAHGSFPYSGHLESVHYAPGPPSPDSPAALARLWAQAARIYD